MGLDTAALNAIRNWTYEPATFKGRPVAVYYMVVVNFALEADSEGKLEQ